MALAGFCELANAMSAVHTERRESNMSNFLLSLTIGFLMAYCMVVGDLLTTPFKNAVEMAIVELAR